LFRVSFSKRNNKQQTEQKQTNNTKQMNDDELLMYCFAYAVRKKLKDKDVPILATLFYANFMLPSRPPNTNLEIKKTKYKKFSKFLEEMKEQKVVAYIEQNGVTTIQTVAKQHEM
jgi:translation initiation factor 2D